MVSRSESKRTKSSSKCTAIIYIPVQIFDGLFSNSNGREVTEECLKHNTFFNISYSFVLELIELSR